MPDSKRRLAAILFADIQGYTALMGKDENHASSLLRKFQAEIERQITGHQGQVVNLYGDGALCTFDSPLDAVKCGIQLQETFQKDPVVPVRVGIHSGTAVFENGKAYGNSVNVASRIESMSVPGAVLVSKNVKDELKNQPEFQLAEMGTFTFKNVDEPMRVFALANEGLIVPDPNKVEGRFLVAETKNKADLRKRRLRRSVLVILFIFLIGAVYWFYSSFGKPSIPKDEYTSVLVMPFEVQGSSKLAYLSDGMVDLLSASFDGVGPFRSIDPNAILTRLQNRKGFVLDPQFALKSFSDYGPDRVVTGSISHLGDALRIVGSLYNEEGELIGKAISNAPNEKLVLAALDSLCRELISMDLKLKNHEDESLVALSTGNMEALKKYLEGNRFARERKPSEALQAYEAAVMMDSTLALGWYKLFLSHNWGGNKRPSISRDTVFKKVQTYRSKLPSNYQLYLDLTIATLSLDFDQVQILFEKGRIQYKKDPIIDFLYGESIRIHGARDFKSWDLATTYNQRAMDLQGGSSIWLLRAAFLENNKERFDSLLYLEVNPPEDFLAMERWLMSGQKEQKELEAAPGFFSPPGTPWEAIGPTYGYNLVRMDSFNRLRLKKLEEVGVHSRDLTFIQSIWEQIRGRAPEYELLPQDRHFATLSYFVTQVPDPALFPEFPSYFHFKKIVSEPEDFTRMPQPKKIFPLNTLNAYCGTIEEYQSSSKALQELFSTSDGGFAKWYYYFGAVIHHRRFGRNELALAYIDSLRHQKVPPENIIYYNYSAGPLHLIKANILFQQGKSEDALKWYESINYMGTTNALLMGQTVIQKAKCLERLGQKQEALKNYTYFLELFQDCDPYYYPWIEEAEAARLRIIQESG